MSDTARSRAQRPRLGRGLSSLIVNSSPDEGSYQRATGLPPAKPDAPTPEPPADADGLVELAPDQIAPNPYQPRQEFDADALDALAESIRRQGLLQPLVVARAEGESDTPYRLIAGERRLRAARQAGLERVPCIIRRASRQELLEWALIENIHRADLNPIERAEAYRQYLDRFSMTQAEVAERLGQPRATVANYLRLLDLQDFVRDAVASGALSFGQAKILASLVDSPERQRALADRAVKEGLTVRRLEALAAEDGARASARARPSKPPYLRDVEDQLTRTVGTRVAIQPGRRRNTGRIIIDFYGLEDFDRICETLGARIDS
ncbi:MAG: ParB/RepB/Spo0J family partition protein [Planctomycetota bacterium]